MISVASLHVYPLKSAAGVSLPVSHAGAWGFPRDRCWMLVDGGGRFLSQREYPALAAVRFVPSDGAVSAQAPGMAPLRAEWPPRDVGAAEVRIWDSTVTVLAGCRAADDWFSRYLGVVCRLVGAGPATHRPLEARHVPEGGETAFADTMPYHLVGESSVEEISARSATPVPADRFRANIVVRGSAPFAEDSWGAIQIGGARFRAVKPVARCPITTVDQQTGGRGMEPLASLARFRMRGNAVYVGVYLVAERHGPVRVGDAVEPL